MHLKQFYLSFDLRGKKEQEVSSGAELRLPNYFTYSLGFLVRFRSPETEPLDQRCALWLLSLTLIKMETDVSASSVCVCGSLFWGYLWFYLILLNLCLVFHFMD